MWIAEELSPENEIERTYFCKGPLITIGRSKDHNINIVNDSSISKKHAEIIIAGNASFLRDLGSKFGCAINESKMRAGVNIAIESGSIIQVGALTTRLRISFVTYEFFLDPRLKKSENIKVSLGLIGVKPVPIASECTHYVTESKTTEIPDGAHRVSPEWLLSWCCVEGGASIIPQIDSVTGYSLSASSNKKNEPFKADKATANASAYGAPKALIDALFSFETVACEVLSQWTSFEDLVRFDNAVSNHTFRPVYLRALRKPIFIADASEVEQCSNEFLAWLMDRYIILQGVKLLSKSASVERKQLFADSIANLRTVSDMKTLEMDAIATFHTFNNTTPLRTVRKIVLSEMTGNDVVAVCCAITGLEEFDISNVTKLTDNHVTTICKRFPNLRNITIIDCTKLTPKTLATIAQTCTHLKIFVFMMNAEGNRAFTAAEVEVQSYLADIVRNNPLLEEYRTEGLLYTVESFENLLTIEPFRDKMKIFSISDKDELGPDQYRGLLTSAPLLESLYIENDYIFENDYKQLLPLCHKLQKITLKFWILKDFKSVVEGLSQCQELTEIVLHGGGGAYQVDFSKIFKKCRKLRYFEGIGFMHTKDDIFALCQKLSITGAKYRQDTNFRIDNLDAIDLGLQGIRPVTATVKRHQEHNVLKNYHKHLKNILFIKLEEQGKLAPKQFSDMIDASAATLRHFHYPYNDPVNAKAMESLTKCVHLQYIDLSEMGVKDTLLSSLAANCHRLHTVKLYYNPVTTKGIQALLKRHPFLMHLEVGHLVPPNTVFRDDLLDTIRTYGGNMKKLGIAGNVNLTLAAILCLSEGCPYLWHIDVSFCMLALEKKKTAVEALEDVYEVVIARDKNYERDNWGQWNPAGPTYRHPQDVGDVDYEYRVFDEEEEEGSMD